jgi:hypothetical protein
MPAHLVTKASQQRPHQQQQQQPQPQPQHVPPPYPTHPPTHSPTHPLTDSPTFKCAPILTFPAAGGRNRPCLTIPLPPLRRGWGEMGEGWRSLEFFTAGAFDRDICNICDICDW